MVSKENTDKFVDWLMDKTLKEDVSVLHAYQKHEPQNFWKRAIHYPLLSERKRVELDMISIQFSQMTQSVEDMNMYKYGKASEEMIYILKSPDHFYRTHAIDLFKKKGLV